MTRRILPQKLLPKLTIVGGLFLIFGCTDDLRETLRNTKENPFSVTFWETPKRGADYPEMRDPRIAGRASFGVAFQGGGNRAAPAALGQLRALHELGWIDEVRYISAISGGSWTAIPYTYLKTGQVEGDSQAEQRFLGETHSPQEAAKIIARLQQNDPTVISEVFPETSMLAAIADAEVTRRMFRAYKNGRFDESYSAVLEQIYLRPFGLGRSKASEPDSLFSWQHEDAARIPRDRRNFKGAKIHVVERERPYLIVGGSVLTQRWNIEPETKYRSEMTPLYSGVPANLKFEGRERRLGGGFVESYGYDYTTQRVIHFDGETRLVLVNPQFGNRSDPDRLNFSLANVAAVSGAAPVETLVTATPTAFLLSNVGFPEHYVPNDQENIPYSEAFGRDDELYQKEWAHGDGGHEDNLGLAPLLARQVDNIIVFANAFAPLDRQAIFDCEQLISSWDKTPTDADDLPECLTDMIGADIPSFFLHTKSQTHNDSLRLRGNERRIEKHPIQALHDILGVAKDLEEDGISCKRYDYTPSKAMVGVPYAPTICFVYLALEKGWIDGVLGAVDGVDEAAVKAALELDREGLDKRQRAGKNGFGSSGFPHLGTFVDDLPYLIKTPPSRLYALSNLTSWSLEHHQDTIRESFQSNGLTLP